MQLLFDTSPLSLQKARSIIQSGGLVAFPTETVYGLGADGLNPDAVAKIFKAKGRPQDNPLILHIARIEDMELYAQNIPDSVYTLASEYCPGPLTFVLEKKDIVPSIVTAGLDTVCLRIPNHRVALDLIELSGVPIAAPSANLSGRPSPTDASHVHEDLGGRIDMILDGGPTDVGIESTVLDCTQSIPVILREGAVTREMIESTLRITLASGGEGKKSPGTRYRHYAPDISIRLTERDSRDLMFSKIITENKNAFIYYDPSSENSKEEHESIFHFSNLSLLSRSLFAIFRQCEQSDIDTLFIERIPLEGLGSALMNRIEKAAGGT